MTSQNYTAYRPTPPRDQSTLYREEVSVRHGVSPNLCDTLTSARRVAVSLSQTITTNEVQSETSPNVYRQDLQQTSCVYNTGTLRDFILVSYDVRTRTHTCIRSTRTSTSKLTSI